MPALGHRPVGQVEPHELLAVLKRLEGRGNLETAKRTRVFASRVFRYAVLTPSGERTRLAHVGARLAQPATWPSGSAPPSPGTSSLEEGASRPRAGTVGEPDRQAA